ncbi:MAG: hypothetical protein IJP28_05595, partial [Erysipelotrichales bacterium]|nr:hypothetical protein [Erysipelotrichales bacterium]
MTIMNRIYELAKNDLQKVAFPEATEEKILLAARECTDKEICKSVLVGNVEEIKKAAEEFKVCLDGIEVYDAFEEEALTAL